MNVKVSGGHVGNRRFPALSIAIIKAMDKKTEEEGLETLKDIEEELNELKERTATPTRAFILGIMQGMGAVIGSIAAVVLLGWTLSVFGLIPGLSDVAEYLRTISDKIR